MRASVVAYVLQNIAFAEVAGFAQSLKVLVNGLAAPAPRNNVIDVKSNAQLYCRTRSTNAAREIVPLHDAKSGPERRVSTSSVTYGRIDQARRKQIRCIRI